MKNEVVAEARKILLEYLKEKAREKDLSTYKIAELTGMDQPNIHRILNNKYSPTLDTFILLCQKLDCYLFIIDKDAESDLAEVMKKRWKRKADEG